ncbi:hypothetical protein CBF23_004645 [Marinomonas agarivorans]|nr:hypothetical protein CBF23_004645 [Marinomonas agarivorans]
MNIRNIVERQITQQTHEGTVVSNTAQFALLMSLFSQPGPALYDTDDMLNQHTYHPIARPIGFANKIDSNPTANIALLKALGAEPLVEDISTPYDAVNSVNRLLAKV